MAWNACACGSASLPVRAVLQPKASVTDALMRAVIILVGNKSDLTEQREVTTESGQEYAER